MKPVYLLIGLLLLTGCSASEETFEEVRTCIRGHEVALLDGSTPFVCDEYAPVESTIAPPSHGIGEAPTNDTGSIVSWQCTKDGHTRYLLSLGTVQPYCLAGETIESDLTGTGGVHLGCYRLIRTGFLSLSPVKIPCDQ